MVKTVVTHKETLADALYRPTIVNTAFKYLFSIFATTSINYKRDSDFNRPRDFQAYWKQTFAAAQQQISDFGTLPNAATFDGQFRAKIRLGKDLICNQ